MDEGLEERMERKEKDGEHGKMKGKEGKEEINTPVLNITWLVMSNRKSMDSPSSECMTCPDSKSHSFAVWS